MIVLQVSFGLGHLGKNNGTEQAPKAVFEELNKISMNEQGQKLSFVSKEVVIPKSNAGEALKAVSLATSNLNSRFCVLGGDHAMTYASFRGFQKNNPDCGILVFDAHPDLMQSFSLPTHENFLRMLVEEKIVSPERVVIVGLRSVDVEEQNFIKHNSILSFPMKNIFFEGIENICDAVMEAVRQWKSLYVSVDIDVLDPSCAPGTGYPEAGGLSTRELLYFLQRINKLTNLKAFDVVEVNPQKDFNNQTVITAAKIVSELYG